MDDLTLYDFRVKEILPDLYGVYPLVLGDPIGVVMLNHNAVKRSERYVFRSVDGRIFKGLTPDLAVNAYLYGNE